MEPQNQDIVKAEGDTPIVDQTHTNHSQQQIIESQQVEQQLPAEGQQEEEKQGSLATSSRIITNDLVKYYQWDEKMTEKAKELIEKSEQEKKAQVTDIIYQKFEKDAKRNWDLFYKSNKTNFYKDRHYIKYEFVEMAEKITGLKVVMPEKGTKEHQQFLAKLQSEEDNEEVSGQAQDQESSSGIHDTKKLEQGIADLPITNYVLLDAGCGVGNGLYPLFREYKSSGLRVHCCDFSPRAIDFVKKNDSYDPYRIDAQACDLVNDASLPFEKNTANFGLFLFVLSAISPENHKAVVKKIYDQMSPNGGILYFRDYGRYDLAQLRLAQRSGQKLKDNFYVRSDKTRAYYFTTQEVKDIFENAGFTQIENEYHYRLIENRKDQKVMHRVWIQAKFIKQEQIKAESLEQKLSQ